MKYIKNKEKIKKIEFKDIIAGCALFIIAGIMPLIVRQAQLTMPPELLIYVGNSNAQYYDYFAYWKTWFLIIPVLVVSIHFLSDVVTGKRHIDYKKIFKNPIFILIFIYLFFVILSNFFSEYRHTAFYGTYERSEGVFVQIAYVLAFIMVIGYVREDKFVKPIMAGLIFSSLLIGLIGTGQLLGYDFFKTSVGKWLVSGSSAFSVVYSAAYGTIYNPNPFSAYSSMLASLFLIFGFAYKNKRTVKIIMLICGLLMLGGLVGSHSLGGILGFIAAIIIVLVTGISYLISHKKRLRRMVWMTGFSALILFTALAIVVPPIRNIITANIADFKTIYSEKVMPSTDFAFQNGNFTVYNGDRTITYFTLSPNPADNWLKVLDGNNNEIPADNSVTRVNTYKQQYTTWTYTVPEYGRITLADYRSYFTFSGINLGLKNGKITAFRQTLSEIDIEQPIDSIGFKGYETWGNGRGYIWSRSFPLMLRHLIIGAGSDSFINVFPQDDIIGKKIFMRNQYMLVDKAHNLYIQTGITTGGISMLALISLIAYYIITTLFSLVRERNTRYFGLRMGILAAVSAFATSSMATDGTIGSTGVFFVILGLGYALNGLVVKSSNISI
jgi:hypothetical protein